MSLQCSGFFDSKGYLTLNPDVAAEGLEAFYHYSKWGHAEKRSIILLSGVRGIFDDAGYLDLHADVKAAGMTGIHHYTNWGFKEGRPVVVQVTGATGTFDKEGYEEIHTDLYQAGGKLSLLGNLDAFQHYSRFGHGEYRTIQIKENGIRGIWDGAAYWKLQKQNGSIEPFEHYANDGYKNGAHISITPTAAVGKWNSQLYLEAYPDVNSQAASSSSNKNIDVAWNHYSTIGWKESRLVCLDSGVRGLFAAELYVRLHPDLQKQKVDGLQHFLQKGFAEQRKIVVKPSKS